MLTKATYNTNMTLDQYKRLIKLNSNTVVSPTVLPMLQYMDIDSLYEFTDGRYLNFNSETGLLVIDSEDENIKTNIDNAVLYFTDGSDVARMGIAQIAISLLSINGLSKCVRSLHHNEKGYIFNYHGNRGEVLYDKNGKPTYSGDKLCIIGLKRYLSYYYTILNIKED